MSTLTRQIAESLWGPELISKMDAQLKQSTAQDGIIVQHYAHARGPLVLSASTVFDCAVVRGGHLVLRFHCAKRHWLNAMILLATAEDSLRRISKRTSNTCLAYHNSADP